MKIAKQQVEKNEQVGNKLSVIILSVNKAKKKYRIDEGRGHNINKVVQTTTVE